MRDQLLAGGVDVVVVDAGVTPHPDADVSADAVARAAPVGQPLVSGNRCYSPASHSRGGGVDLAELREGGDRGRAVTTMGAGAAVVVRELFDAGRVDGVLAVGGSGGSSIAARVMANSGHLPAYGLHQVGIDPNSGINAMYLGTHTAVFQALLAGRVDAAELASTQIAAATSAHQYDPAHLRMLRPRRPRRRTRSWCAAT